MRKKKKLKPLEMEKHKHRLSGMDVLFFNVLQKVFWRVHMFVCFLVVFGLVNCLEVYEKIK